MAQKNSKPKKKNKKFTAGLPPEDYVRPEGTENWIGSVEFARRYHRGKTDTIHTWRKAGYLTHKACETKGGLPAYLFPPIPPHKHEAWKSKPSEQGKVEPKKHVRKVTKETPQVLEKRRRILGPFYEKFVKDAPPGKMFFTAKDLMSFFGIDSFLVNRQWMQWGLEHRQRPTEDGGSAEKIYDRETLVKFLSGNFDFQTEVKPSYDTRILNAAMGDTEHIKDGFYRYDIAAAYPITGEGCLRWLYDKQVRLLNHRTKEWEPVALLDFQESFIFNALMTRDDGDLKHKIAIACWRRGEGKSMCVKLLGLFLFFNLRGQKVVFSGSSKDQADKVLFKEIKEIVQKTPDLNSTPGLVVQEARIILKSGEKSIECELLPVSTGTGLLTGTTAAFFTELHEQEDSKFFEDLYSSLRGVPNGIAFVDTTVAKKGHIVHKLWDAYRDGDEMICFDYSGSKTLSNRNPEITKEYLAHQKRILMPATFRKYFYNLWDDVSTDTLSKEAVRKFGIAGIREGNHEIYGETPELKNLVEALVALESERDELLRNKVDATHLMAGIKEMEKRFIMMDDLYDLPATSEDLIRLEELFDTTFTIFAGMDRAQMTRRGADRTVFPCLAIGPVDEVTNIILVIDMFIPADDSLPALQHRLLEWKDAYSMIEKVTLEKYETKDLARWCEDNDICNEVGYSESYPSKSKKREIFVPLYMSMANGYFKSPTIPYYVDDAGQVHEGGSNKDDIFLEEASIFIFDEESGIFKSPEKGKGVGKIKDDTLYATAWGSSGATGADLVSTGEIRKDVGAFSIDINNATDLLGDYDDDENIGEY